MTYDYNPGENVLGHLRKLGTKTHFAKLTDIFYLLKKLGDIVIRGYFCYRPLPQAVLFVLNINLNTQRQTAPREKRGGKIPQFEELLR